LTSTLDGSEWSVSRPGRFTPRERAPGNKKSLNCRDLQKKADEMAVVSSIYSDGN